MDITVSLHRFLLKLTKPKKVNSAIGPVQLLRVKDNALKYLKGLRWVQLFHGKLTLLTDAMYIRVLSQYVNWNKHPVPVPPSSRLIHYELQHSCVTSCRKSWCESCWYSCNCEGPPIKIHFSIDLSNCYSYNHVIMYTCDCQFHLNRAIWHLSSFSTQNVSDCEQVIF